MSKVICSRIVAAIILCMLQKYSVAQQSELLREVKLMNQRLTDNGYYYKLIYSIEGYAKEKGMAETVDYYKWGDMSCTKTKDVESYENDKYRLVIYHNNKEVIVNNPYRGPKQSKKDQLDIWGIFADTLMKTYQQVKLVNTQGRFKTYRIVYPSYVKEYAYSDIKIDTVEHLPVFLQLHYKKNVGELLGEHLFSENDKGSKPVLVIRYMNFRNLSEKDKALFYSPAVSVNEQKKITISGPIKQYKLENYYSR